MWFLYQLGEKLIILKVLICAVPAETEKNKQHNETKYSLSYALSVFFNSEAAGMWRGMWRNKRQSTLFSLDGTLGLTEKFEARQFFLLLQKATNL